MALTIAPIAQQNITSHTAYNLPVTINGNPDTVEVKGILQGFYYTYESGTLTIAGETQRIISNAQWEIIAKKGSETVTSEITYNVVPPAPIIASVARQIIPKGEPYSLSVQIGNNPSEVKAEGHLIGLKYTGTNPLKISGTVPTDAKFTVEAGTFVINAKNTGGIHTRNIDWEFARNLYGVDIVDEKVYVFPNHFMADQTPVASRVFNLPSNLPSRSGAAIDGNDLYVYDHTNDEVIIIPADTAHLATATATRRFFLNNVNTHVGGLTVDEENVYIIDRNGNIRVYDKTTANNQRANPIRSFDAVDDTLNTQALTHDDTYLYIGYRYRPDNLSYVSVVRKDTADGATPTIERSFRTPFSSGYPTGMVLHHDDIYCASSGTTIYVFPKNTADGGTAVASRQFNPPSGADSIRGLAIG